MRRVVVTGLGLVSPLGMGVGANWARLIEGVSGVGAITSFEVADLPSRVAGQVPRDVGCPWRFDPDVVVSAKDRRRMGDYIVYGLAAAAEAVEDAGWIPGDEAAQERVGVIIGSGIGSLQNIAHSQNLLEQLGPRRVHPFFIPSSLVNMAAGYVSMKYGFKGPNSAVATACATGAHAIGDASRIIRYGDADVMVAGGAEAAVCRLGIAGFASMRALSTHFNDAPERASRPYDRDRDGFVIGEGAGAVVLEEYEHAKARDACIYAELCGYGLSSDAHHITAPAPDGGGQLRAMRNALKDARVSLDEVDYINAHGTSTPPGDEVEVGAVKRLFGDHAYRLSMSSTKSATGHLLGAAGAIEAVYAILSMRDGLCPPTLNLERPSPSCDIDLVPKVTKERRVRYALSNSFGFGGANASVLFGQL